MSGPNIIVHTNCDCGSGRLCRSVYQIAKWASGPRCPGCNKVLGPLEWAISKKDDARVRNLLGRKLQASVVRVMLASRRSKQQKRGK